MGVQGHGRCDSVDVGTGSCCCVEDIAVAQYPGVPLPSPLLAEMLWGICPCWCKAMADGEAGVAWGLCV